MMTGWKYEILDRQGVRRRGAIVGGGLETEEKARAYLRHTYGEDGDVCPLSRSGGDVDDMPDWRRKEIAVNLPAFLRKQAD